MILIGTAWNQTKNYEQLQRKEDKHAPKSIHRHTVHNKLNKDSKQLGNPPKIADEKHTVLRIARIRLAQLRNGYCPC